jgi:hypothetical protein
VEDIKPPDAVQSPVGPPPTAGSSVAPQVIQFNLKPDPPEEPLLVAMRYFLDKQPSKAVKVLEKYDKPNQDMLLGLLPVLVELTHTSIPRARCQDITALVDRLESLRKPLVPRAELLIDKMVFCEWIRDFGRYLPLEENHVFYPSTSERRGELVQIYVELSNLASMPQQGNKFYETRVASTVDIRRVNAKRSEWGYNFKDQNRVILSRAERHDFCNNYSFYVPHLPPGQYILTIHITDCLTQRKAEKSLRFDVSTAARPRLANAR